MPSQIATSPLTLYWFWSNPRVGFEAKLAFELVCESGMVPFSAGNVPVVLVGVGKSGVIAQKIAATMTSTGTAALYLHPSDALHGGLGILTSKDIVIALSNSGETDEVLRMLSVLKKLEHPVIAVTSSRSSTLARYATVTLGYGKVKEACPLGLAPTASTTAMLVLGDALFLSVMKLRRSTAEDFALFHPAGNLGDPRRRRERRHRSDGPYRRRLLTRYRIDPSQRVNCAALQRHPC